MLTTPGRRWVGGDYISCDGVVGVYDHGPPILEERDSAYAPHPRKLVMTRVALQGTSPAPPPPVFGDGVEEEARKSWMRCSTKRRTSDIGGEGGFERPDKITRTGEAPQLGAVAGFLPRRACSGCGAYQTPMWRSGPAGPKTLCNACGIRYRKMKRRGGAFSTSAAAPAGDEQQKGNACRVAADVNAATTAAAEEMRKQGEKLRQRQRRRQEVLWMLLQESRKLAFRCGREEAEAAVLLMAISSGLFVHTSH